MRRRPALAACMLLAACASAAGTPGAGEATVGGPREAVVRVGAFADVWALASAPSRLFVVGEGGVAVYDRAQQRWAAPIPLDWGPVAPARLGPVLAATNLIGDVLWVAAGSRVWVVRPALGAAWSSDVGDDVRRLIADRGGADAYAIGARWTAVGATGGTRPLDAADLPARQRLLLGPGTAESARMNDPLLHRDAALRVWPVSAGIAGDSPSDLWLGTAGGGVFHADLDFHRSTQIPFGLRSASVRALARVADGVLVADDPPMNVDGEPRLTFASDDLAGWRWLALDTRLAPIGAVAVRGEVACVGGYGGAVLAAMPRGSEPMMRVASERAVPDPVTAAAAGRDGCYVGTDRGLWLVPWPGSAGLEAPHVAAQPLGDVGRVWAIATSGDTAWALSERGLVRVVDALPPMSVRLPAALPPRVAALALTADGLALAAGGELWIGRGTGRTDSFERSSISIARVGRVAAMAADGNVLWIGGDGGALAVDLASGRVAGVPTDDVRTTMTPAFGSRNVRAIVLAPGLAWLGTAAGLVRVRRGTDGFPR